MFVECQHHFESHVFTLFQEIQTTIVKFQSQDKNFAIFIFVLLVNVKAYQSIIEEVLRHSLNFDSQKLTNYKKVMISSQRDNWFQFIKNELQSHRENDIWVFVFSSIEQRVLENKWIYKLKRDFEEKIQRYKVRWVVRDFEQRFETDFNEIFVAVIKSMIYKMLFIMIVRNDWNIDQMNVKTVFLYENLNEIVYVNMLTEFDKFEMICKLNKTLYDLKQISRVRFKILTNFLIFLSYHAIFEDFRVYRQNSEMYEIIYVDDLLITKFNKEKIVVFKQKLSERFHITDLKFVVYYLDLKVHRDRRNKIIRISQIIYLRKIMTDLNMHNFKRIEKSMNSNLHLESIFKDFQSSEQHKIRYQSVVDSLMYLMFETRSDIVFAMSQVSRFSSCSTDEHWTIVQRIFRYLKKNFNFDLIYNNDELLIYTDANWTRDNDRKSIEEYFYKLEKVTVNWSKKRQNIIVLFNCETEYMTTFETIKKTLWMRRLLNEFDYQNFETMIIQVDNQNVIALIDNSMHHNKIKHIELKYYFIRKKIIEKFIKLIFVSTKN